MLSVWEINEVLLQEKEDFFAVFPWFWSYFFSRGYSIICCPIVPLYQELSALKVGTYVVVDMFGLPADTIKDEFRTKVGF